MSNEASYSFTTKIGGGNDLFTVRGDTYEEFISNLGNVYAIPAVKFIVDLMSGTVEEEAINVVTASLGGTTTPAPAFSAAIPQPPAAVVTPTVQAAPPATAGRNCVHGAMTPKQGVGKDGKVWRGYMCPSPAGATDKCKNQYIYPNQPEWHTFVAA